MSENELVIPVAFTKAQFQVYKNLRRFNVLVTGRRWGKSHFGITVAILYALNQPRGLIWYIAPTYRVAKHSVWSFLVMLFTRTKLKSFVQGIDRSELSITLKNNSVIALKGADNPDSLRGTGLILAILDEYASMDKRTWSEVVRPMLSDTKGSALIMGSPAGFNHFHDMWSGALDRYTHNPRKSKWMAWQFTSLQGGWVDEEEIEEAKSILDPRIFKQEYEASFETLSGRVYLSFDRQANVAEVPDPSPHSEILVGMDFNVNPMSAVVCSRVGDQLHVHDCIELPNAGTHEMAVEIKRRWGWSDTIRSLIESDRESPIFPPDLHPIKVYPDPSGRARKTSSPVGTTDFVILKKHGFPLLAPNIAPLRVDRFNTVNALLKNALGQRRLLIHPRCRPLIKTLEGLTYREGTSDPDISSGLDHMGDALGYLIINEFPILFSRSTEEQRKIRPSTYR